MQKNDKVVWVTGASSGIGAALVKIYDQRGGVKLIFHQGEKRPWITFNLSVFILKILKFFL